MTPGDGGLGVTRTGPVRYPVTLARQPAMRDHWADLAEGHDTTQKIEETL